MANILLYYATIAGFGDAADSHLRAAVAAPAKAGGEQKKAEEVKKPEPKKEEAAPKKEEAAPKKEEAKKEEPAADDDDEFDMFGEITEEEKQAEEARKKAMADAHSAKQSNLPIAKSNVILNVKVWDDTIDLNKVEELVRAIEMDGLQWGPSKKEPVAFGIFMLQISCVIEDDKVSTEDLEEKITSNDEYVQSVDIAAFTKV
eukprot:TRINITY_DN1748_c0_g1_i1.p1 TRINITY_DN1748_c0_g1~~TRINITY_DN1748_c0_g1_i1.p1  ORF type:complete len:237 (+),score=75.99 TRINITY_DN1748_c0_g1_i1:107-712(+)